MCRKNGEHGQNVVDAQWLRFQCMCDTCRQPSSNQRMLDCADIPEDISICKATIVDGNRLSVRWAEDAHDGWIGLDWLYDAVHYRELPITPFQQNQKLPRIDDHRLLIGSRTDKTHATLAKLQFYNHLLLDGFCIVSGLPTTEGTVKSFVEDVFALPVQKTIYGEIFDVLSTPNPINVAYSNAELKPHIDLVYYESPPGLQLLHCLRFDETVEGGESTLVDGIFAAEEMIRRYPQEAEILINTPATFEKIHFNRDLPVWMRYSRPHIAVDANKKVTSVFWAPQFEGPLRATQDVISKYYSAYRKFARLIHDPSVKIQFRLQPGEVLVFNNRRMLHGRNAFTTSSGLRHFQGCYVHIDEFKSQAQVSLKKAGKSISVPHVANQSCF
ncbi:gamma-butyrobetaine dioxygenase-like isoform X2 [Paramacrobiotus metropolitanus]|uniref:gamma-butyrobetaine dioxygenase-like isoform X2 n=1 Tax=Paramacrobiotus metropolitanus TaxID=2943436 RepID=UPI002445E6A6|nr:gamma-butyrobetaine dioxygenase-like isoform X2 [Paramacrobiotus metropolitanus]